MENPYHAMREQIIHMQGYFAKLDDKLKQDPEIYEAATQLSRTRGALERLWVRTSNNNA